MAISYENHHSVRRLLNIYSSEDDGKTWGKSSTCLAASYEAPFSDDYHPYMHVDTEGNIHIVDVGGNDYQTYVAFTSMCLGYNYNGIQHITTFPFNSYATDWTYFVLSSNNMGEGKLFITFENILNNMHVYTFNEGEYSYTEEFTIGSNDYPTAIKYIGNNQYYVTIGKKLYLYSSGSLEVVKDFGESTAKAVITDTHVFYGASRLYTIATDTMEYPMWLAGTNNQAGISENYLYSAAIYTDTESSTYGVRLIAAPFSDMTLNGRVIYDIPLGNDLRGYEDHNHQEVIINTCATAYYIEMAIARLTYDTYDVTEGPADIMFVRVYLDEDITLGSCSCGPITKRAYKTNNRYGRR